MNLQQFVKAHGITAEFEKIPEKFIPQDRIEDYKGGDHHRVTLRMADRVIVIPCYSRSSGLLSQKLHITNVLDCCQCDYIPAGQTFEDWCSDFGYDTDSRKAEATYKACLSQSYSITQLLGSDLIDEFLSAND